MNCYFLHLKAALIDCLATWGQRDELQSECWHVNKSFPLSGHFFFLKGLVLCPPAYRNTSGSVLVHQLVAYFVCLLFVAGQVVEVFFCFFCFLCCFVEKSCLLRLKMMLMRTVRGNQNSQVVGCKMLKGSRELGWAAQLGENSQLVNHYDQPLLLCLYKNIDSYMQL